VQLEVAIFGPPFFVINYQFIIIIMSAITKNIIIGALVLSLVTGALPVSASSSSILID
jgi:hypothetical protein